MAFDPDAFLDSESAVATTFADPRDVERYRRAIASGATQQQAFKVGDNGVGAWGDDTTRQDDPIVALPRDTAAAQHNQLVEVDGPGGKVIARVADKMPKRANITNGAGIDLNPAAAAATGVDQTGKAPVRIRLLSDPADGFDPDAFLGNAPAAAAAPAGQFNPDEFLGTAAPTPTPAPDPTATPTPSATPTSSPTPTATPSATPPAATPFPTPAATPAPTAEASQTPTAAGPSPAAASTPAASQETAKPESETWWWERAARGVAGGAMAAAGSLLKAAPAALLPGDPDHPDKWGDVPPTAEERGAESARRKSEAEKVGSELQAGGKALTESAPAGFARKAGEVVGGIVPFIGAEVAAGPAAVLPMLFASGYQEHKDGAIAAAKQRGEIDETLALSDLERQVAGLPPKQDSTAAALAGGALNMALGLPVFKVVKGVARAIVPDAAGTVQRTVREVYEKAGIPGVETLTAALSAATRAGERWTEGHARALGEALKSLDKEIRAPVTRALRRVILNSAESAGVGGTVTTGHNLIAQTYDPNRPTFEGVPEALATFGAIGAIGATGQAIGDVRSAREAQAYLRQKFQERPVEGVDRNSSAQTPASVPDPLSNPALPPSSQQSEPPRPQPRSPANPSPAAPAADSPSDHTQPSADSNAPNTVPSDSQPDPTDPLQLGNDPEIRVAGADVVQVPTPHIALRPELMQFKAIDDRDTGTNKTDEITAPYDPVKADNLLLWEPTNPAEYGLTGQERYIAADGHHRHSKAVKDGVARQNVQILRESAGFSANDARTIAAEKNIAGGKGTIFDQAKFIRNVAATHGPDAAMERAGHIGARGRKAATIALAAEPDLYASFINEQISPEHAAAIANVAPRDAGLQRLGITRAIAGDDPDLVSNFLQAVRATMGPKPPTEQQIDLFAADDAAIKSAERAARKARAIQREIGEQINSVAGASRRPEKARQLGVNVEDPAAVQAKLVELQGLRERARNWALDDSIRDLAMSGDTTAADAVSKLQTTTATAASATAAEFNPDAFLSGEDPAAPSMFEESGEFDLQSMAMARGERIVAAAVRGRDGTIHQGATHGDAFESSGADLQKIENDGGGYVTNKGRYLNEVRDKDLLAFLRRQNRMVSLQEDAPAPIESRERAQKHAAELNLPADKLKDAQDGIAGTLQLAADPRLARRYEGDQGELFDRGSAAVDPRAPQIAPAPRRLTRGKSAGLEQTREASAAGFQALAQRNPAAVAAALTKGGERISILLHDLIDRKIPGWNIDGAIVQSAADFAMLVQAVRSPYFESLKAAVIDKNNRVISSQILHVGTLNETVASPRDLLTMLSKLKRKTGGERVILSHNHPSGDPSPSAADVTLTERLKRVADLAGFKVVDHIITNGESFYSFADGMSAIERPIAQLWEIQTAATMPELHAPELVQQLAATLRSAAPDAAHIIYVNTRMRLTAVERLHAPADLNGWQTQLERAVVRGIGREGAYGVMIDLPAHVPTASTIYALHDAVAAANVKLLDVSAPGLESARVAGQLPNSTPDYYSGNQPLQGLRAREDSPGQFDFFENQLQSAERRARERRQPAKPKPEQFDMFAGTAADPFNLAGEKGIDYEARQREAEAQQREAAETRQLQEQQQTRIPGVEASGTPPVLGYELGNGPAAPADDPTFTAFPVDLPEAVRFGTELLGVAIQVKKQLGALKGEAAGVFRHTDGPHGKAEIHLRADIADLLTDEQKAQLATEAQDYAERVAGPNDDVAAIARDRYEFLLDQAYDEAKTKPPVLALKVIWHEIGHAVDWLPQKMISGRGNLLGHVAALKKHLDHVVALDPNRPAGQKITDKDKRRLLKEAEAQLRREMAPIAEIVETIMVEEPILRIVGITPADIRNLFGMDARETMPELYRWFAEQPADVKKEIVRKAMRDVLDERLAKLGKSEQVGTRTVKRTVRKKVGREPTIEEIRERFRQLFREELQRRNLAHLQLVKNELQNAIAWWHGTAKMPSYFKTATEMYAEAFSIFMNNPAALQKRAPTFARLVWNYMDARPEVAALYRDVQNRIKSGQVEDDTEAAMLDSWDKADEQGLELSKRPPSTLRDFLDNVSYHMDRRMGPIYRAAKGSPREAAVRNAIGSYLYRASEHELFLTRMNAVVARPLVEANLDWSDLGRYLFYQRVVEERFKMFNPYGIAPDRALKRLALIQQKLGPARWATLQHAADDFRALYQLHVVTAMKEARLWSPALQQQIDSNVYYATFDVRKDMPGDGISRLLDSALGGNVGPHIYRQIGTVKEIKNPATATVLKSLSLISAAARNIAKRETVAMLRQSDPTNILEARKRWTGTRWEHVTVENNQVGTVVYLEEGKPQAYYVRKVVADALNKGNSIDNRLVLAAVKATSTLKGLFTQLNYAFWPVNFVRDTFGWVMQMPGATPKSWVESSRGMLREAHRSVKGRPNRYAELALQRRMLISRADPQGIWSAVDNEFELKLASFGLDPAMWSKQEARVGRLVKVWNMYRELGQSAERVNKLAGMHYLDTHFPNMPEWQKREIVRERAGSPDFLQRGASNPYIDFMMMFYNPWKEGIRSVVRSARENPWSFAAKAVAFVIVPTVLQALASSGIFGDDKRRQYRSIPDYDLSNYLCIPLSWQDREQGKVMYLRLPLWEPSRILHGTLWQFITGRGQGLGSFYGGTVPSMNAILNVAKDWMDYEILGNNPYDEHRGKLLLDDTTFQAGGWPARQELLKQTWNNLGGSIAFRFQNKNLENAPETDTEKFLQLPIVNNALNRWVKVSNRGLDDADRQLTEPMQQMRAQQRLAVHEIERRLLAGEALTPAEKMVLRDPYALEYLQRTIKPAAAGQQSNLVRRIQGRGREEKAMILTGPTME